MEWLLQLEIQNWYEHLFDFKVKVVMLRVYYKSIFVLENKTNYMLKSNT